MSVCAMTGSVSFDHLVKMVSARLLCHKVTIFSLCNKYLMGKYLGSM